MREPFSTDDGAYDPFVSFFPRSSWVRFVHDPAFESEARSRHCSNKLCILMPRLLYTSYCISVKRSQDRPRCLGRWSAIPVKTHTRIQQESALPVREKFELRFCFNGSVLYFIPVSYHSSTFLLYQLKSIKIYIYTTYRNCLREWWKRSTDNEWKDYQSTMQTYEIRDYDSLK